MMSTLNRNAEPESALNAARKDTGKESAEPKARRPPRQKRRTARKKLNQEKARL